MHKSRLGTVIIDCNTDDLEREARFWGMALGGTTQRHDDEGRYVDVQTDPSDPQVILQKVDHPSRIHIDIETNDIEAEVERLQGLGAVVIEKMERWTVMEAPSKHRFCIIGARRQGFDENANIWE
ncbi:MAG: VOC family protein [Gammaproteobacteria bacterium]|nr:VOC family protein [Gammaproteobacteria bacterium]MCP4982507.1 VOC family protein [Gammaproteobacteria bacterium]